MQAHLITGVDLLAWVDRQNASLLSLSRDTYGAKILQGHPDWASLDQQAQEGFTLYWTDWVINEWGEWFPDLPTALLRLAVLEKAADGGRTFTQDPDQFRALANAVFASALTA